MHGDMTKSLKLVTTYFSNLVKYPNIIALFFTVLISEKLMLLLKKKNCNYGLRSLLSTLLE